MNLQQSVQFAQLRDSAAKPAVFGKKTRQQVEGMLAGKVSGRVGDWLSSDEYILLDVPLHYASTPMPVPRNEVLAGLHASIDSDNGVVIDLNARKVGMVNGSFAPPVLVIAGAAMVQAARLAGRETIRAWVGIKAAHRVKLIHADHQLSSSELQRKLQEALEAREAAGEVMQACGLDSFPGGRPWIREVYPLENYVIYTKGQQDYRQKYSVDIAKRAVKLTGSPTAVKQKYVDMNAGKSNGRMKMSESAGLYAGVSSSMSEGSGNSLPKMGRVMADFSGIPAPQKTSETLAKKTRGATNSEMAQKLKNNDKPGKDDGTDDVDACDMKMKKTVKSTGYYGYKKATKTQSNKTKGASKSEMAPQLEGNEDPNTVSRLVTGKK